MCCIQLQCYRTRETRQSSLEFKKNLTIKEITKRNPDTFGPRQELLSLLLSLVTYLNFLTEFYIKGRRSILFS